MPAFGAASMVQYATLDPDLQRVCDAIIKWWDCTILEGKRSEARQKVLVATGKSEKLDSKHVYPIGVPSLAMDLAPFPVKWSDSERFYAFGGAVVATGVMLGIRLRWGGDWDSDREFHDQNFFDLVHFEKAA